MNPFRASVVVGLLCAAASAQDWPQFRGPDGNGHTEVRDLPLKWGKGRNIAWQVDIPGKGWSSPAYADGKLYLTTAVLTDGGSEDEAKAPRSLRVLCLDARDGKTVWNVEAFPQDLDKAPRTIHFKNSHASPSPIVHGGRLYVHFGHQGTACLDLNGKKIWESRALFYEPFHGGASSPIVVDDKLIFSCDGIKEQFVAALKLADGALAWKFMRKTDAKSKFAFATPVCILTGGKKQIISPGADVVNALDPDTGEEIWRCRYEGYSIVPKPVFGNGMVYVCTSFESPDVLAIKPDGRGDVTDSHVVWQVDQSKRPPKTCSMLLDGDLLYWVSDNGLASCVDAKTGDIIWNERAVRDCSASPLLADGRIYIQDERGKCIVLKTGRQFEILAENDLELGSERTFASYAVTKGTIFLRSEKQLYCIREQ